MSGVLTSSDLTWMRAQYKDALSSTCTVSPYSGASTDDAYGGHSTPGGTPVTGIPYSYMAAAGNEKLLGGAVAQVGNYVLRFGTDVALTPEATVTDEANAKVFNLIAPLDEAVQIGQRWLAQTRS